MIEGFGSYLKGLVDNARIEGCSAKSLARALGFMDASTVYRWMRGVKTPALNTEYVSLIIEHLRLTPAQAHELRHAQIRSIQDSRSRPPRRRPEKNRAPVAALVEHTGVDPYIRSDARQRRATRPHAQVVDILLDMIDLFNGLPDATNRAEADKTIVLTWQSRDPIEMTAELQDRWVLALQSALRRGWHIEYLCRLDANVYRTVRLVEMMHDFVGVGEYLPRYFTTYGALTPSYDLLIIPGIAAVTLFATRTAHASDAGIITRDVEHIHLLLAHARQLAQQTTPLVTAYFMSDTEIAATQTMRKAESHRGGRCLVKDGLSVITQPEAWFDDAPILQDSWRSAV